MRLVAIACIGLAAYLQFPLSRQRLSLPTLVTHFINPKSKTKQTEPRLASNSEIIRSLEMIRLGMSAGMTVADALEFAMKRSPRAAALEIEYGLNQFRVGFPLERGLEDMAVMNHGWRSISDTLINSIKSGSSVVDQLSDVEYVLQSSIDTEKLKQIKSVAVKSVLPLGLCFLPAFILLAIVPIVAGFISGISK
jgi:pilus assembly protein TadC